MNNYAFIDGQNLRIGTTGSRVPWRVDLYKFRRYLREKYNVAKAYYFIGYMDKKYRRLYGAIKRAGFELVFRVSASLLYRQIGAEYFDYLDKPEIRRKIESTNK